MEEKQQFATVKQLSERWQFDPSTVRRYIHGGKLRAVRIGGSWRVPSDEVVRFEERGRAYA